MPTTTNTTATTDQLRPQPGRLDLLLTLIACIAGLLLAYSNYTDGPTNPASEGGPVIVSIWAVPTFLVITLPMLWRSSAPLVALGGVIAGLLVHFAAFGEIVHCGVAYPMIAILGYAAGHRLRGKDRLLGLALTLIAAVTTGVTDFLGPDTLVLGLPLALVGVGLGTAIASRTQLVPIREEAARA